MGIKGIPTTNKANAGVGSPSKYNRLEEVILNLAKRYIADMVIRKESIDNGAK